jgi:hypothetical protein
MKTSRLVTAALFAGATALGALSTAAANGVAAPQITEVRADQTGADNDEWFELTGPASASLAGLTYLVIGDGTPGSGTVEAVVPLSGSAFDANGFFVVAESTFTLGAANLTANLNFENGDNVTHLLVSDFTGTDGMDLDTDNDGTLDATPWTAVLDCVALFASASSEHTYCPSVVGPDGTFAPGHVYRCADTGEWKIGPFDVLAGVDSPGDVNPSCGTTCECDDSDPCTEDSCDPATGECVFLPIPGCGDCCVANDGGCADAGCAACVCAADALCCGTLWDETCASATVTACPNDCTCADVCDVVGDTDGDGTATVADVNCVIAIALWDHAGQVSTKPACAGTNHLLADGDCSGTFGVLDVQISILYALTGKLPTVIDSDQDLCGDTCHL